MEDEWLKFRISKKKEWILEYAYLSNNFAKNIFIKMIILIATFLHSLYIHLSNSSEKNDTNISIKKINSWWIFFFEKKEHETSISPSKTAILL